LQTEVPARPDLAGALAALRAATRLHHDRIDRTMDLQRLQERSHYLCVLRVFDSFLAAWEPAIARALPGRAGWLRARSRRPFLQRDLQVLDAGHGTPCALSLQPGAAAAWGSLYVVEGSALGGQLIAAQLARCGLGQGTGAAYFHGWGEATGGLWREFRQLLEQELDSPAAIAAACQAARVTFETLTSLLENALHERTAAA
jgi:heme oxygenase